MSEVIDSISIDEGSLIGSGFPVEAEPLAGNEDAVSHWLRHIGHSPLLTKEQEHKLSVEAQQGNEESRRVLVESNFRLVINIARRFSGRGVPMGDLIQEGNLGLVRAVEKFDPELGYRFSTYATWWIRQSVARAVSDQGRTIRIPVHLAEALSRLLRIKSRLQITMGREPTNSEIGALAGMTPHRVAGLLGIPGDAVSLESPIGESSENVLGDLIEDRNRTPVSDEGIQALMRTRVKEVLTELSEIERQIISLRFGINDGVVYSLDEISRRLELTRERVRQIEMRALRRLKSPQIYQRLQEVLLD